MLLLLLFFSDVNLLFWSQTNPRLREQAAGAAVADEQGQRHLPATLQRLGDRRNHDRVDG